MHLTDVCLTLSDAPAPPHTHTQPPPAVFFTFHFLLASPRSANFTFGQIRHTFPQVSSLRLIKINELAPLFGFTGGRGIRAPALFKMDDKRWGRGESTSERKAQWTPQVD